MTPFLGSTSELSRQRLRGLRYRRLSRDVYTVRGGITEAEELHLQARAGQLVFPDAVVCRQTAALLQRLPVDADGLVHLARTHGAARSERAGVQVHGMPVAADERLDLAGVVVTDGPRTFVDLAAVLDLERLVAVGDVVARRDGQAALRAAVRRGFGRPGAPAARRALLLVDPRSDSPAETRARLRLHESGFRELQHGVVIRDRAGGWLAQPDLADERAFVAVQYDGAVHSQGDDRRWRQDVLRDELCREQDWQVVVLTAREDRHPHLMVARVADAYRRSALVHGRVVLPPHLRWLAAASTSRAS